MDFVELLCESIEYDLNRKVTGKVKVWHEESENDMPTLCAQISQLINGEMDKHNTYNLYIKDIVAYLFPEEDGKAWTYRDFVEHFLVLYREKIDKKFFKKEEKKLK